MNSYNKGQETVLIKHPISKIKNIADAIFTSQEYVKKILIDRQIAIETCPSSNLRISQMETLDNHSIFKWQPPGNQTGLHALIATDNPGLCHTNIPIEYCAIKQAAQRQSKYKLTSRELDNWINSLNNDTDTFSFLN